MEPGHIVEFIDRQKITCAVVLDIKNLRLRLLTENNREVNLSAGRLSHRGDLRLDLSMGRDKLVDALKKTALRRRELTGCVDIKELWEVLNTEQEWIDLPTMTRFCFPKEPTLDHESAVIRAFFNDRQYFKFNPDRFFPNTQDQVESIQIQAEQAERKNRLVESGGKWLKAVMEGKISTVAEQDQPVIEALKSYFLFEKESPHVEIAQEIVEKAGYKSPDVIFQALVALGIWDENENFDLLRYDIPRSFPEPVVESAEQTAASPPMVSAGAERRDLTDLSLMTIDGQATLDFDDAISLQREEGLYRIGVHITDVGHYVRKGDAVDREAMHRASSIYMPDQRISMIPPRLAEDLCSLKAGQIRPAISMMIRMRPSGEFVDFDLFPSIVRVHRQLTYHDVHLMADEDETIGTLYDVAKKFQQVRLEQGAVQISLPEVSVWIDAAGQLAVSRTNRESPGRLLIAELMILANWLAARYLAQRGISAIFRSQAGPRERLFKDNQGSLFQNWMQRRFLSRFVLSPQPEPHSGLGLDAYVTATSPIRKYYDLVTQRQIRSSFGLETAYSQEEIRQFIGLLETPMSQVGRIQYQRNRYWLLKYLEGRTGKKEEAIVIQKRKNGYLVLLTEYMVEALLPVSAGITLNPEAVVQVTVQHVDARRDVLSVFLG